MKDVFAWLFRNTKHVGFGRHHTFFTLLTAKSSSSAVQTMANRLKHHLPQPPSLQVVVHGTEK